IATIFDLVRDANYYLKEVQDKTGIFSHEALVSILATLSKMGEVLGLEFSMKQEQGNNDKRVEQLMELLLELRQEARANRDFKTADIIRDRLKELGVAIEDTPQGARWKWQ
ncbi:MAG: DALR domain-containing protein, partial [Bacillota bacterium]|nr:DALR domain-containing protein [Bacillota bacterium]